MISRALSISEICESMEPQRYVPSKDTEGAISSNRPAIGDHVCRCAGGWVYLLWRGAVDEFDAFRNVPLEAIRAGLQQLGLLLGYIFKDVDGLLSTVGLYRELDNPYRRRKEKQRQRDMEHTPSCT